MLAFCSDKSIACLGLSIVSFVCQGCVKRKELPYLQESFRPLPETSSWHSEIPFYSWLRDEGVRFCNAESDARNGSLARSPHYNTPRFYSYISWAPCSKLGLSWLRNCPFWCRLFL